MVSISNHVGSSKRLKKVSNMGNTISNFSNEGDRISKLPVPVLIHILSFLPTKYAVRTSILSSRWKRLWASVPMLDFDFNSDCRGSDKNFMSFVDRVLLNHDLSYIQKFSFSLSCHTDYRMYLKRIYTWISVAIKRGVQVLEIHIEPHVGCFDLPMSLFTCPTLRALKLGKQVRFDVPCSINLRDLRILHLSTDEVETYDMVEHNLLLKNIIRTCPVLEDLFLDGIYLDPYEEEIVDLKTPTLKRLRLERIKYYDGHKIVVNAPSLEYLTLQDDSLPCFVLSNLTSLVKADFINVVAQHNWSDFADLATTEDEDRVLELLCEIGSVKYLSLGACTMKAIRRAKDTRLLLFPNLIRLKLCLYGQDHSDWGSLLDLLKGVPRLVNLVLKSKGTRYEGSPDFNFVEPEEVPYCLSYLQTIKFSGFTGREDELTLMEYILRNAKALQQMKFDWWKYEEKKGRHFQSKLLMFPRASRTCQILFSSKVSMYRALRSPSRSVSYGSS